MANKLKQSRQTKQDQKKTGIKRSHSFEKHTKITLLEEMLLESGVQQMDGTEEEQE